MPFELDARRFVPRVIVVADGGVEAVLDLLLAHAREILRGEQPVHRHLDLAPALVQAVFGVGEVAAGNPGDEHGHAEMLEHLAAPQGAGLVAAADRAHAFREDDHLAAAAEDPVHRLDRVNIRGEILLGNDLQQSEYEGQVRAEKLVVPRDVVEPMGEEGAARVNVIEPRRVVAHDDVGTFAVVPQVDVVGIMHIELLLEKHFPEIAEAEIRHERRPPELSGEQLFVKILPR
jgi:hypothetical protein